MGYLPYLSVPAALVRLAPPSGRLRSPSRPRSSAHCAGSDSLVRPGGCGRPPALAHRPTARGPTRSSVRATAVALPPSLIGRLRAQMDKRPVDLGTRDSAVVFAVLLLGIFAISASVLTVV